MADLMLPIIPSPTSHIKLGLSPRCQLALIDLQRVRGFLPIQPALTTIPTLPLDVIMPTRRPRLYLTHPYTGSRIISFGPHHPLWNSFIASAIYLHCKTADGQLAVDKHGTWHKGLDLRLWETVTDPNNFQKFVDEYIKRKKIRAPSEIPSVVGPEAKIASLPSTRAQHDQATFKKFNDKYSAGERRLRRSDAKHVPVSLPKVFS